MPRFLESFSQRSLRYYGIAALAAIVIFFPVVRSAVFSISVRSNDFLGYDPFVRDMSSWGMITRPNFLYPLLLLIVKSITGSSSLAPIHLAVVLTFYGMLAIVLLYMFEQQVGRISNPATGLTYIAMSIALMVLAPFALLFPIDGNLYFGYIGITVYHNASMALVRPIALLHFFFAAQLIGRTERSVSRTKVWSMPPLLLIATLAKPNYTMALVPAVLLWCGYRWLRKQPTNYALTAVLILLPAFLILSWQYLFTYLFPNPDIGSSRIIFAPFEAYRSHSHYLFEKFLLSALFPLAVVACYWGQLKSDAIYIFAWILFGIGVFFNYGFAEDGIRMIHMNFAWTGQITLFILCVFSMLGLCRVLQSNGFLNLKAILCIAAFALQLFSGAAWYYHEWMAPGTFW